MKKTYFLLALLLSACRTLTPAPVPTVTVTVTPSPGVSASPVPSPLPSHLVSASPGPRLVVGKITNATAAQTQMIRLGESMANSMLAKKCFKEWVLAANYSERNDLSQKQIFDKVTTEVSKIDVEVYYEKSNVVGFEYDPFDGIVHMNTYIVNPQTDAGYDQPTGYMAGDNLIHEDRGHSLGFHHYGKLSSSVPYGMNYAYEGCYNVQEQRRHGVRPRKPHGLRYEIRKRHGVKKKGKAA